jgi:hypothetical protein
MKLAHVLILAATILAGCGAIATSNLLFSRFEYRTPPINGRLSRVDKATGAVEIYRDDRGWSDARLP